MSLPMTTTTFSTVTKVLDGLDARDRREEYINDPILWAHDRLGVTVWHNPDNPERSQAEVLRSIAHNHDTAVKAGHGTSKSFSVGLAIVWWVDTRYPDCFVASTAPSVAQISGAVWAEVRKFRKILNKRYVEGLNSYPGPPGYITSDNFWKEEDGTILGWGRKPPEQDIDSAFQGIHRKYVLAVGDEATGLSGELIDSLSNITSNSTSRRVIVCNPTNPASYIGKLFKTMPRNWHFITLSVFDNPNFTGEKVPKSVTQSLSDETYVNSKREEYGEGSARWKSRVLGEFAQEEGNPLFTDAEMSVGYDAGFVASGERPVLGVDVARFGKDLSVIYTNDVGLIRFHSSWGMSSGTDTAHRIHRAALDTGARQVRIDASGLGGPIADMVINLRNEDRADYDVIQMIGSAASPNKRKWHNARAWWYDGVRHNMLKGKIDIDINDDKMVDELTAVQYKFSPTNALLIESKDDMRKRGLKSPDFADAFIYAAIDLSELDAGLPQVGDTIVYDENDPDSRMWDTL
jgi:hypothetical protein